MRASYARGVRLVEATRFCQLWRFTMVMMVMTMTVMMMMMLNKTQKESRHATRTEA